MLTLKKEFKNTSKTLTKNNKEPKYRNVFKFSLSGLKKLIFDLAPPQGSRRAYWQVLNHFCRWSGARDIKNFDFWPIYP